MFKVPSFLLVTATFAGLVRGGAISYVSGGLELGGLGLGSLGYGLGYGGLGLGKSLTFAPLATKLPIIAPAYSPIASAPIISSLGKLLRVDSDVFNDLLC